MWVFSFFCFLSFIQFYGFFFGENDGGIFLYNTSRKKTRKERSL